MYAIAATLPERVTVSCDQAKRKPVSGPNARVR